jgi:hypothetical protein
MTKQAVYPLGSPDPPGGDPAPQGNMAMSQQSTDGDVPSSGRWERQAAAAHARVQ